MALKIAILSVAAVVGFCMTGEADAAPNSILVKAGGDYAAWQADRAHCRDIADSARYEDLPPSNPTSASVVTGGDVAADVGSMIAFAIVGLIETDRQRKQAETLCMRNLGYAVVKLTREEEQGYRVHSDDAVEIWQRKIRGEDWTARVQAALTPVVPRLPPYQIRPFTQGGLEVDSSSLVAAVGPVAVGDNILGGKAMRWRTAVLAEPFSTGNGLIEVAGNAGAVFNQVDFRPQKEPLLRPDGATWCGPVTQTAPQSPSSREVYCFTGRDDGYEIYQSTGYDWFGGPYGDGFALPRFSKPIVLQERTADDLSPLDFGVRVKGLTAGHAVLEGYVSRNHEEVVLWRRRLTFGAEHSAVLPLWTKRLVLNKGTANAVTAMLDDKGDGHGWRDGD